MGEILAIGFIGDDTISYKHEESQILNVEHTICGVKNDDPNKQGEEKISYALA